MNVIQHRLQVPLQHPSFPGHFPGEPIVPGALLLQWLMVLVRDYCSPQDNAGENNIGESNVGASHSNAIWQLSSVKFKAALHPGDYCDVELVHDETNGKVKLSCHNANGAVCKVQLSLGQPRFDQP